MFQVVKNEPEFFIDIKKKVEKPSKNKADINYKKIFRILELAEYLEKARQAIYSYKNTNPKRYELLLLGFACYKLNIDYTDLKEINKMKGFVVKDNNRNGYKYFYTQQELADYLNLGIEAVRKFASHNKKRNDLIKIGFACKKINVDFEDLMEFYDYKKQKEIIKKKLNHN